VFLSNHPHCGAPDVDGDQEIAGLLPALGAMTSFGCMFQRLLNLNADRATKTAALDQWVTPFLDMVSRNEFVANEANRSAQDG